MKLHGYFRSSASYRVRIALNLKGLNAEHLSYHLRKGEQRAPGYLAIKLPFIVLIGAALALAFAPFRARGRERLNENLIATAFVGHVA